jgi:hypothetical protein
MSFRTFRSFSSDLVPFPSIAARTLLGYSRWFVFLCDYNLEAGVTLRRGIHRLVGKDDRRSRRYNFLSLGKEFSRQPTFLRGQKKTLARAFLSLSSHLNPAKMSVCIRTP